MELSNFLVIQLELISSGANVLASEQWIDNNNPEGIVVTILCDRGERYFSIL